MTKVSFSGFPGSGKTSLLNEVKKILLLKYKVESLEEITRKNPFDEDQKSGFDSQFFYISTQINEENIKKNLALDFLLCDRSILDQWIYWRFYISDKEMSPQLEERHNILKSIYRFWVKTYDLLFLIRGDLQEMEKRESSKEFRRSDLEYNKKIEEIFLKTIKEDELKVIEIWNNSTVDEAAHQILKHLSEYKTLPES